MLWFVLIILACVYIYLKVIKPLNYWKDRGIPYQQPWPFIGNLGPTLAKKRPFIELMQDFYNAFPNERYNGTHYFTKPALIVRDLNLIKQITTKDFDHFTDHNVFVPDDVDPLMGSNLFLLNGQRWREMRSTLSPAFTSSKMRAMFTLLCQCSEQFIQYFQKQGSDVITLEMRDTFSRFTNDAIASITVGLEVDSLKERNNEFYLMGRKGLDFSGLAALKFFLINISPTLAKFLGFEFFAKSVSNFFRRIVKETIQHRESTGLVRPDMIHLLMEARKGRLVHDHGNNVVDSGFAVVEESHVGKIEKHQKHQLSDDDITAQPLLFFIAGFETIATLMSFIAYELAVNLDVQEKLQKEIDDTLKKCTGKITYEALLGMKYLDAVVSETLRKWPPGFRLDRVCVKDYTIPPVNPTEKPYTIEKGQLILIPVYGIHRDPKYFPNPEKFDPERFNEENKHNIQPATYMPFGAGPRSCIASRLALLQNKTMIVYLLSKFDIVPVEKTVIPVKFGTRLFKIMPNEGLWLGFRQRKIRQNHAL